MYQLTVATWINAAPAKCFDLARSVDAHLQSAAGTGERVVAGRAGGLLELGTKSPSKPGTSASSSGSRAGLRGSSRRHFFRTA
jgi:hypothetical protein